MKLVIYQTSDVHGYMYPTNYVKETPLGMLKIGSYIQEDEKHYDASLKIDCGDLTQGSPMTHYLYKTKAMENPIISGMEAIGFDNYVLGNHEFNYGLDYLSTAYRPIEKKIINANIEGLPFSSKPYQIYDYNGFKVACIGLTTSFIPNWEQEANIKGLTFLDPVAVYGHYEEELKAQADYIIVCYHGGFERSVDEAQIPTEKLTKENQASELLANYPSINLILSGHQHRSFITQVHGVVCTQPMHNGQNFAKVVLDTETRETTFELVNVSDIQTPIDPKLEAIFSNTQAKLETYLDSQIGHFDEDLLIQDIFDARLNGHPLIQFLHQVQLAVSAADLSVTALFDSAIGFKQTVSIRDVLINYPYPNTLRVLKISGHKVKEAIEKSATYFILEGNQVAINPEFLVPKVQNYNYDMFGGLDYVVDLHKPMGERVISMTIQGKPMDLDKDYTIVMNNYRASNTSVYPCYENALCVKEINLDMSELLINYFQEHGNVSVDKHCNYQFLR